MTVYQLIYASELAADESVLAAIHSHAVRNNTARTVTGMLLYVNGRFLQILEGERKDVLQTFARIQEDSRHRNVNVILERESEARMFSHWNMGFKQLTEDALLQSPPLRAYFERSSDTASNDSAAALSILSLFV